MLAKVRSCAVVGIEGLLVEVEVEITDGSADFIVAGLAGTPVN